MMRYFKPPRRLAAAVLLTLFGALAGCSLAPPYKAPDMVLPASTRERDPSRSRIPKISSCRVTGGKCSVMNNSIDSKLA
jgi:hypothetical protein